MRRLQLISSVLLALPLIGSTANHYLQLVEPPLNDGSRGAELWEIIRGGGLMDWIAAGHLVIGAALLLPRTRFAAALVQLPITVGIVAFNATMFPSGVPLAIGMLAVNLGALASPGELRRIFAPAPA